MKKLYGFIAVIIVLSILLPGCKSDSGTTNKNTDTSATHTDDAATADTSEDVYGTLTDDYYINEWLGLFLDLSANDLSVIPRGTIETYYNALSYIDETALLDMCVANKTSDENLYIGIYIADAQGKTIDEFISKIEEAEKNNLSIFEEQRTVHLNTEEYVDFLGEQYLSLHATKDEFTYTDENIYTADRQFPFTSIWCLCRIKDDKFIAIRCRSYYTDIPLEEILQLFEKVDDIADSSIYNTDKKKPNYSEEQVGEKIMKVLLEETINDYYTPSYAECIDRLFKDYTWTFKPLSGYDYLYVATFTGTYYLHPSSYYQLGDATAYGSMSLLVDIREEDEIEGFSRLVCFDGDDTEGKQIYKKFNTLVADCPQSIIN